MPIKRDVIVIGASAGGVEALEQVVRTLPVDLPAAVFVVMHVPPRSVSLLPRILSKAALLPAFHAQDGDTIEPGRIFVAPPDYHLVVERGHVHLGSGPKEQHSRPCINVTFRTAAAAYGERVAGVLLTGELDDGTAGLWEIERRGGVTVVQNPEEAAFPSMPLSALREMEVDHTVSLADIGPLLGKLATNGVGSSVKTEDEGEEGLGMDSQLTDLTCPECRGTIWEIKRGNAKDYRCRVGHTYSAKSMLAEHVATQEKTLYSALVALEEGASLMRRLADDFDPELATRLRYAAAEREEQAKTIRGLFKHPLAFEIG